MSCHSISKGNIIFDIKREKKENWERRLEAVASYKSISPVFDNGSMIAINRRVTRQTTSWRTELCGEPRQSSLAILIPHYNALPSSCNTRSLRPRVIEPEGRGGTLVILKRDFSRFRRGLSWRDASKRKRYTTTSPDPPKTLREECPTKWHLECSAFNPLHRRSAPTFLLLSG